MPMFNVTLVQPGHLREFSAYLYDDVEIGAQYDTGPDTTTAVVWNRGSAFLVDYQAGRLESGWFPTFHGVDAMKVLSREFGLYIGCLEQHNPFEVVGSTVVTITEED